jgi:N-acetylmuramoyl-L-alanine amidase-like
MNPSRRDFLWHAGAVAGLALLGRPAGAQEKSPDKERQDTSRDSEIFREKMSLAAKQHLHGKPIGDIIVSLGLSFLGTPYVAHTLEEAGEEHLVVNLRGLDCTTFMENSLVLARCVKKGTTSFDDFVQELTFVRYRDGRIAGYPSRLHYFTDWVYDNTRKGVVKDVTAELGGVAATAAVDFMSNHPESYVQLSNPETVRAIRGIEESMKKRGYAVVPKERVQGILGRLRNGDIIGTATTIAGMDVSHTGVVVRGTSVAQFLHAPLSGGSVCMAQGSLGEYLAAHTSMTGIIVARPLDPPGM